MAFKFFNIGKANAEIDRLESELATAKAGSPAEATKIAELTKSNEEISTLLENATTDLSAANGTITKLKAEHASALTALTSSHETAMTELRASVGAKAAEAAVKIQAATGAPAAPVVPKTAADPKAGKTGMARLLASAAADLLAGGYQKKTA